MGNHDLPADLFERDPASVGERVRGDVSRTMSSPPSGMVWMPRSAGWKVSTPKSRLRSQDRVGDLAGGHPADFDRDLGCSAREPLDVRQQRCGRPLRWRR